MHTPNISHLLTPALCVPSVCGVQVQFTSKLRTTPASLKGQVRGLKAMQHRYDHLALCFHLMSTYANDAGKVDPDSALAKCVPERTKSRTSSLDLSEAWSHVCAGSCASLSQWTVLRQRAASVRCSPTSRVERCA